MTSPSRFSMSLETRIVLYFSNSKILFISFRFVLFFGNGRFTYRIAAFFCNVAKMIFFYPIVVSKLYLIIYLFVICVAVAAFAKYFPSSG